MVSKTGKLQCLCEVGSGEEDVQLDLGWWWELSQPPEGIHERLNGFTLTVCAARIEGKEMFRKEEDGRLPSDKREMGMGKSG